MFSRLLCVYVLFLCLGLSSISRSHLLFFTILLHRRKRRRARAGHNHDSIDFNHSPLYYFSISLHLCPRPFYYFAFLLLLPCYFLSPVLCAISRPRPFGSVCPSLCPFPLCLSPSIPFLTNHLPTSSPVLLIQTINPKYSNLSIDILYL